MKRFANRAAHPKVASALRLIFRGIEALKAAFPNRGFTIDGRLVGDLGEIIASLEYDVELDDVQRPVHDAKSGRRDVQIKATFKNQLTCRSVPDFYLGLKLYPDGTFEEIYNGPGKHIATRYGHRSGFGENLLSFPISELRRISQDISSRSRIARRRTRPLARKKGRA